MIKDIVNDLRRLAEKCTRVSRGSATNSISHALEELGVDLMAKALELEQKYDR